MFGNLSNFIFPVSLHIFTGLQLRGPEGKKSLAWLRPPTIAGTDALPAVVRSDVRDSGGTKVAQLLPHQADGVPAASRRTAAAQAAVVTQAEDTEAQRVLQV